MHGQQNVKIQQYILQRTVTDNVCCGIAEDASLLVCNAVSAGK